MDWTTVVGTFDVSGDLVEGGEGGTTTGTYGDEQSVEDEWLRPILYRIRLCFLPIIVAGTITNCLNFVVLTRREMRSVSTSVYLFALAVADLGVMYFELFRVWFEWSHVIDPKWFITDSYCRLANFSNNVVRDYSNWLVACLTLERVIRIASPYGARVYCTRRRARAVVLGLFAAICIPHVHALIFSRAQIRTDWVCWEDPQSTAGRIIAGIVEFVVGYIVVIVVFVLNIILTLMIYRNRIPSTSRPRQMQQQAPSRCPSGVFAGCSNQPSTANAPISATPSLAGLVSSTGGGVGGGGDGQGGQFRSGAGSTQTINVQRGSADVTRRTQNRRLTRTLMSVALVFLVCETPRMITSVVCRFGRTPFLRIVLNASFVLSGVNHAANFFIYVVSSPRFRQLFIESLHGSSAAPLGRRHDFSDGELCSCKPCLCHCRLRQQRRRWSLDQRELKSTMTSRTVDHRYLPRAPTTGLLAIRSDDKPIVLPVSETYPGSLSRRRSLSILQPVSIGGVVLESTALYKAAADVGVEGVTNALGGPTVASTETCPEGARSSNRSSTSSTGNKAGAAGNGVHGESNGSMSPGEIYVQINLQVFVGGNSNSES